MSPTLFLQSQVFRVGVGHLSATTLGVHHVFFERFLFSHPVRLHQRRTGIELLGKKHHRPQSPGTPWDGIRTDCNSSRNRAKHTACFGLGLSCCSAQVHAVFRLAIRLSRRR